jgi:hypothetical protein
LPAIFIFTSILPFVPDAIFHGSGDSFTVVQSHDVRTFVIVTVLGEILVKSNEKSAMVSPAAIFIDFVSLSQTKIFFGSGARTPCGIDFGKGVGIDTLGLASNWWTVLG